jgi:hypothetical protein
MYLLYVVLNGTSVFLVFIALCAGLSIIKILQKLNLLNEKEKN